MKIPALVIKDGGSAMLVELSLLPPIGVMLTVENGKKVISGVVKDIRIHNCKKSEKLGVSGLLIPVFNDTVRIVLGDSIPE